MVSHEEVKLILRILLMVGLLQVVAAAQPKEQGRGQGTKRLAEAQAEARVALVIGNSAYAETPLRNPVNDANDVAAALQALGFTVLKATDANLKQMEKLIHEFGEKLAGSSVALFFFAGHGVQVEGENYLIPIDAVINKQAEVKYAAVNAGLVLAQLGEDPQRASIVILDACRNNPFRSFRSLNGGLAALDAPAGSLIAYATSPGKVASDGSEHNGLFTGELLKQLRVPGLSLADVLMQTGNSVRTKSKGQQVPWQLSSLGKHVYLNGKPTAGGPAELTPEQALWNVVQYSREPQDVSDFLRQYPNSRYAEAAQILLRRLTVNADTNSTSESPGSSFRAIIEEPKPVVVSASAGWVATGLILKPGQQVEIQAGGSFRDGTRQIGAAGLPRFEPKSPLPSCQFGALLARVGNGPPVCMRDKATLDVTQAGELQLGVNDNNLQDNKGVFNATITVRGVLQHN